ncbi:MAG: signal peptide peptidase SppA [bacterium]
MMQKTLPVLLLAAILCAGCFPNVTLLPDYSEPFKEVTLEGKGADKILLLPVKGFITTEPRRETFGESPSLVQEVTARLDLASRDPAVKGIVLLIDSPGGTSTASDILYQEIMRFREETDARVAACLLGLATSGGYYTAISSERIIAHPTTVTGSVGTIFLAPSIKGLMDKVGVEVSVYRSGEMKDMGSLFREASPEEREIFQRLILQLNSRFLNLVQENRHLDSRIMEEIAKGRVYSGLEAKSMGLVDDIGYVRDAVRSVRELAGLDENSRLVAYRRTVSPHDTAYNFSAMEFAPGPTHLGTDLKRFLSLPGSGFYYLWAPEF